MNEEDLYQELSDLYQELDRIREHCENQAQQIDDLKSQKLSLYKFIDELRQKLKDLDK